MANRGMLPKFRPATVGGREAPARPMIRPVKPVAPPPPPSPPRRHPSGVRHSSAMPEPIENEHEISTASYEDPPTMAAARQRIHEIARELPSQYDTSPHFDDETQARPVDGDLITASRHGGEPLNVPYDALPSLEIERPHDVYEEQFAEHGPAATQLRHDPHHEYDSFSAAPIARRYVESGEQIRDERISAPPAPKYNTRPYAGTSDDSGSRQRPQKEAGIVEFDAAAYEANYPGVRRDGGREESYPRKKSYEGARRESAPPVQPTHREGSYSNRSSARAANEPSRSEPAPQIPAAPAVPHDMLPAGFVMGVQPLRAGSVAAPMPVAATQIPEAFPAPAPGHSHDGAPRARTPMMGVPYGQPQAGFAPSVLQTGPHLPIRPTTNAPVYAHPVGHQLQMTAVEHAQEGSKVGRFAWFVFGAAFGIFFAFFATGFVPRLGKKEEIAFPPAAQIPQQQAPVAAAPSVVQPQAPVQIQAPVAPPVVAPPVVAPPVVQPQATVAAAPAVVAPPPVTVQQPQPPVAHAAAPAAQPAAAAAPASPAAQRGQRAAAIARRNPPPPPTSNAPKALPGSGSVDADDAPSASASRASSSGSSAGGSSKKGGGDLGGISDLLSAGLGD